MASMPIHRRHHLYRLSFLSIVIVDSGCFTQVVVSVGRQFESIARYCETYVPLIPLSFVLGFYVQQVVNRWQLQFETVPFPDATAVLVTANVKGLDERGRLIRRTMMRYLMLGYVMTMRSIAPLVKKRFPTMKHLTQSGKPPPHTKQRRARAGFTDTHIHSHKHTHIHTYTNKELRH